MSAKRIEFISPEDFQKLYREEKDKNMKLVLLLAFGAGMRISEIRGLKKKVSACCRAELTLTRVESGNRKLKKYFCSACNKALKFSEMRYAGEGWEISPLTADRVNIEKHQIRIDEAKGQKWRTTITPPNLTSEHLKLLPIKTPMRTLQHKFAELSKKVLGKKSSIHILRHGFGNYQANIIKTPLPVVQSLMGHARLDTTGIYTKANPEDSINSVWKAMQQ